MLIYPKKIAVYLDFVQPFYMERDPGHDFAHICRIVDRLEYLAQGLPQPNLPWLHFLACFHGLNRLLQESGDLYKRTVEFLKAQGWGEPSVEEAFLALQRHLRDPRTVEEMIVHDANFMELLGAFGIAKAFTTGGARGQKYEETMKIFMEYIENVSFRTPMGRRFAAENTDYTLTFINRLRKELEWRNDELYGNRRGN
jgi:hypothetical protein